VELTDAVLPSEVLRYGAYLCFPPASGSREALRGAAIPSLLEAFRLENEYHAHGHPAHAVAFLRRVQSTAHDVADDALLQAEAIVHVASGEHAVVERVCQQVTGLLPAVRLLRGVVRPPSFTGAAMHNFAYAHQLAQQPAAAMPNAFLVPLNKTGEWWEKSWLERHTYLLPRYDGEGRMTHEGHALAAAPGVSFLMRRTYRKSAEADGEGSYDFVNYFECSDEGVSVFHDVCAALRDVQRNPEWRFVREGPTWHGRRVASWHDLWA
jgi:hypothetical protein